MKILDRYLLRLFISPLFYCLFIFTSIYIVIDLFGHLDEIVKQYIGFNVLLIYYMAYIPNIITQIMPITILISTMYVLGDLARHNEIIALRASGISLWKILKPFFMVGAVAFLAIFLINDTVVPRSVQLVAKIKEEKFDMKKSGHSAAGKVIRDVAIYGMGNKILYAKSYTPGTNTLRDIVVHEQDNRQSITAKIIAKEAKWTKGGWTAFSVTTYRLNRDGEITGEPTFQHRAILNIKEGPGDFQKQKYKIEVFNISELRKYIKRFSGASGLITQNLLVEAHNRVAYPFANIVAILIGAAFCLRVKRGSRLLGVGLGFLIGLLFYGVSAVSVSLGKGGILPAFASAWLSNIVFSLWGIYLINRY